MRHVPLWKGKSPWTDVATGRVRQFDKVSQRWHWTDEAADPSDAVNRTHRLKALGNGIVPLCAWVFADAIRRVMDGGAA